MNATHAQRQTGSVIYDAGALVAADRNGRDFLAIHYRLLQQRRAIVVPAPVLTQVWRGKSQVTLSRVLRSVAVRATEESTARRAGVLLRSSRTSDAVDAIVVATALEYRAPIVTSDPDDIRLLLGSSGIPLKLGVIAI